MTDYTTIIPIINMESPNILEEVTTNFKNIKYETLYNKSCNGERPSNPIINDPVFKDKSCQTEEYMVDQGTQYDERDYEEVKVNAQDCGDGANHQYYYNRRNMLQMSGTTKEKITKLYIVSVEKKCYKYWYTMALLACFCTEDDIPSCFTSTEAFTTHCFNTCEQFNTDSSDTMNRNIPLAVRGIVEGIFPNLNLSEN
tara:strand:+ start:3907 stop:4500 length:594 start_codon:yes stop_codon:yes gene_type:complete